MRTVISYLSSCFCKHEFELIDHTEIYQNENARHQTYLCKKCGYVKEINL